MPTFHLPYDHNLIELARQMRKNPTPAERKLWGYLYNLPVKILRQKPIDRFIVDFYCASVKLAIELDGQQHYEDRNWWEFPCLVALSCRFFYSEGTSVGGASPTGDIKTPLFTAGNPSGRLADQKPSAHR